MELSRLFSLDSDLKTSKYLCSLFGVKCQGDILFLFLFLLGWILVKFMFLWMPTLFFGVCQASGPETNQKLYFLKK